MGIAEQTQANQSLCVPAPASKGVVFQSGIGTLTADCTLKESYTDKVRITRHPREVGGDFSDHVQEEPTEISCTVFFSDTPVNRVPLSDEAQFSYEVLLSWLGQEVHIITERRMLNAVLKSVSCATDNSDCTRTIDLVFQTVKTVDPLVILLPLELLAPEAPQGEVDIGAEVPEEVDLEAIRERLRSQTILHWLGGLGGI